MANAGIGFVDIVPRSTTFTSTLTREVSSAIAKVQTATAASTSRFTRGLQAGFVALGVVAVAAISKGISATVEWAGEVRTLQRVTGQSAEQASTLAFAAEKLGVGVDKMNIGFGLLSKNIVNGTANMEKYGIVTRDAQGAILPFDDVLGNVIDKFQALPEGPQQAAFAMNVFGRSGRNLIPILKLGRDGLAELREEAEKAGLVMSQDDLDASKELGIAQRELADSVKGAAISLGKSFVPAATAVVKVLTSVVQLINKIPTPILAVVGVFSLLTGAIAALQLIGGFFVNTWTGLLATLHLTGPASTEAAAAQSVATASTVALTAATEALTAALVGETAASAGAAEGLVGFGLAESGLIVPTEALGAAAATTSAEIGAAGAAGGTGLVGSLAGIGAVAGPVILALGAVVFELFQLDKAQKEAHENFRAGIIADLNLLKSGTAARRIRQLSREALGTTFDPKTGEVVSDPGAILLHNRAINQAREAVSQFRHEQLLAEGSVTQLAAGIRSLLKPVDDLLTPISDVADLTVELSLAADKTTPSLDRLSKASGQDFAAIGDSIQQALADPKTTIEDLPGIFANALGQMQEKMAAWHDDIVANFGGAQEALSEFQGQVMGTGKDKVSFDDLNKALDRQRTQLRRWSRDFDLILRQSGNRAKTFLNDMSENGLDSLGILDAVASKPKKVRDEFLKNYNDVNRETDTVADQIADAFSKATDRIVLVLRNIKRAIEGLPAIRPKVDDGAVDSLLRKLQLANDLAGGNGAGGNNFEDNRHPSIELAKGGLIKGASGFVTRGPVFQVGEAGTELVDPLESPRAARLRAQSIVDALKVLGVGGPTGDMRIHVTVAMDESGNLQVRRIAQDEVQREAAYRERVPA